MHILLVEDDNDIASNLEKLLNSNNYEVTISGSVEEAIENLNNKYDLVVLDLTLPDGNGFDLYEDYIKMKDLSTIFLTAKDDEESIVKGLDIGADDYITKPFSSRELIARIKKVLARNKKNNILKVKDIAIDLDKMCVYKSKEEIKLTSLELKILILLFTNLNKVITRDVIIDNVWNWTGNDINDNTVTVYLKRIREKLDTDIIKTIKGIGYRIDEE
jgi:DNA-binding response OmpR family regulator